MKLHNLAIFCLALTRIGCLSAFLFSLFYSFSYAQTPAKQSVETNSKVVSKSKSITSAGSGDIAQERRNYWLSILWNPERFYESGESVYWDGEIYIAKYANRNIDPMKSKKWGPWDSLRRVDTNERPAILAQGPKKKEATANRTKSAEDAKNKKETAQNQTASNTQSAVTPSAQNEPIQPQAPVPQSQAATSSAGSSTLYIPLGSDTKPIDYKAVCADEGCDAQTIQAKITPAPQPENPVTPTLTPVTPPSPTPSVPAATPPTTTASLLPSQLRSPLPAVSATPKGASPDHNKILAGYFPNYAIYYRGFVPADIDGSQYTHILLAFFAPLATAQKSANSVPLDADGRVASTDEWADFGVNFGEDPWVQPVTASHVWSETPLRKAEFGKRGIAKQLALLKQKHPHLKIIASIGGWSRSGAFASIAKDDARLQRFSESIAELVDKGGFDGVDIDWEYPGFNGVSQSEINAITGGYGSWWQVSEGSAEDKANFTKFLNRLRNVLGRNKILSIAVSADKKKIDFLAWKDIEPLVDFIQVMSYDLGGAWNKTAQHNAPLYDYPSAEDHQANIDSAISTLLGHGIPASKLVLGIPTYGRAVTGVVDGKIGSPHTGNANAAGSWERGVVDYFDIVDRFIGKDGWISKWDETARVPYLWHPYSKSILSYDDVCSAHEKADYILKKNLAGVMMWEMSGDRRHDLSNTVTKTFTGYYNAKTKPAGCSAK